MRLGVADARQKDGGEHEFAAGDRTRDLAREDPSARRTTNQPATFEYTGYRSLTRCVEARVYELALQMVGNQPLTALVEPRSSELLPVAAFVVPP